MIFVFRIVACFLLSFGMFAVPAASDAAIHSVQPGESLYSISIDYGVSLNSLLEANGIQDSLIYPGQQLYVPEGESNGGDASYTVQAGDSLYLIGQRFGVSYQDIMRSNGLIDTIIYPDMVLAIPGIPVKTAAPMPQVNRGGNFQRPSSADVDLLARLITAEADGEPYAGKVAVGAVVLNRLNSNGFPKSIQDVIYQYDNGTYQFEPVMNGWIDNPASAQSIQAAKDALSGVDPTNGALYFFANYAKNSWLWSRPLSRVIGNHVFTY
ncbi:MAG: Spore cortex-lytic enzyme precursor [Pelotomaculum sp. PtaB.Bin013]|uniref:Cell wall hydrolase n=1 Tax=Pelotomaculum isophthalicicum JI TaxID=947010 RepID=A0A9X4JWP2_9FIRM|nr:cell wall hydrolase [Pelotomaculum isophthalicicum]MDF9409583.1 cell wall hydrolase [Pelotomaculum isophthalicicum JI]OPX85790.1 MAG: Spore cortex-lytic enzyme precursor [Pelotomaculum sp. PtaB.Bin013]